MGDNPGAFWTPIRTTPGRWRSFSASTSWLAPPAHCQCVGSRTCPVARAKRRAPVGVLNVVWWLTLTWADTSTLQILRRPGVRRTSGWDLAGMIHVSKHIDIIARLELCGNLVTASNDVCALCDRDISYDTNKRCCISWSRGISLQAFALSLSFTFSSGVISLVANHNLH